MVSRNDPEYVMYYKELHLSHAQPELCGLSRGVASN